MRRPVLLLALAALAIGGCTYPNDPDGTLDRVNGGTMRVGITNADPWVKVQGDKPPGGLEVRLVNEFARQHGARIEWVDGSEEELVNGMKEGSLDLMIGGLTKKSRWKKDVAFTRPYVISQISIGSPVGSSSQSKIQGMRVSAERGSEAEALAGSEGADVRAEDKLTGANQEPIVAEDYKLDDLNYQPSKPLKMDEHVMAVPQGENAFLVALERFLLGKTMEARTARLLSEEGKP